MTVQVEKSGERCEPAEASVVQLGCKLLGLSLSGALLWSVWDIVLGVAAFVSALALLVSVQKNWRDLTALKAGTLLAGLVLIVPSFLRSQTLTLKGTHERVRPKARSFVMRFGSRPGRRAVVRETFRDIASVSIVAFAVVALCTFVPSGADLLLLMIPLAVIVVPLGDSQLQGGGLRVFRFLPWSRLHLVMAISKRSWVFFSGLFFGILAGANAENSLGPFSPQFLLGLCLILTGASLLMQASSHLIPVCSYLVATAVSISVWIAFLTVFSARSKSLAATLQMPSFYVKFCLLVGAGLVFAGYVCLYWAIGHSGAYARKPESGGLVS